MEDELHQIEKIHALIEMEAKLTKRLEEVEPWLPSVALHRHSSLPRVRPIPTTMEEVERILAVARSFAARTSAPAGWNPNAPVIGFSTPSPMPHHLRGGALAALQLQRAQAAQLERKRQRTQQQERQEKAQAMDVTEDQQQPAQQGSTPATPSQLDPKRREVAGHNRDLDRSVSELDREAQQNKRQPRSVAPSVAKPPVQVSMNLSDSSSEEED